VFFLGLLICVQTLSVQMAVARLPVTLAILLFYTYPFLTGVASSALGSERLGPHAIAALLLAFVGLTLVLRVDSGTIDPLGVLSALTASASFTAVLVLTPRLAPAFAAPLRTFIMLATAAAVLSAALALTGGFRWPASAAGQFGLIGLGAFYAVGISVLFLVLPLLGATQTAVILNLEPVMVALIAWAALGESLTSLQGLGALLVVGAVIYFQIAGRTRDQRT
jgi:drug/metabolite transporter (DMT)-like permease